VAAGVWVGVGSRDEPAPLAGVSHFLEHLLFKGTASRTARDIAMAVDRVGGDMNAYSTKEYTAFYARLPHGHLDLGLEMLADVLVRPALRDADVESERQVILEELLGDEDSHEDRSHTLAYEGLFPGHPLGWETAGQAATVEAVSGEDVRSFHARWYRPSLMVLAVAGAVDHRDVVAAAERLFPPTDPVGPPERQLPGGVAKPVLVLRRPGEQVHLSLAYRALPRTDPDREPLDVVNHVLGGGLSSRLFDEIRDQRGLAYAVYSSLSSYADAGTLTIYAGTQPALAPTVLGLVEAELAKLAHGGLSDEELEVARGYLAGSFLMGLEDTGSRMARMAGMLTTRGAVRTAEEQVQRWLAVTHQDCHRVVERILRSPRTLAAVGPVTRKSLLTSVA
jgi:predicted Zn-dependent peptidase